VIRRGGIPVDQQVSSQRLRASRYAELMNKESLLHHDMQCFFPSDTFKPIDVVSPPCRSLSAFYPGWM
jgi:hypothetical protein